MDIFRKQRRIVVNNRYTHSSSIRNGGAVIRLTMKKLIFLAILLVFLLLWAFFVGVLVGQGVNENKNDVPANATSTIINNYASNANTVAPEIPAQATPPRAAEAPRAPQAQTAATANAANADKNARPAQSGAPDRTANDTVIPPQELSFMSDLKGKPGAPSPAATSANAPRAGAKATSGSTAQKPPRADAGATGADTGRPEDPAPKATTPPGPGIFDYQYQVAATTDLDGAKRLVGRLRADGLRASLVQGSKDGSKLYRVHVDFRGTPQDTNKLRDKLSKFGIERVILKTKVATQ